MKKNVIDNLPSMDVLLVKRTKKLLTYPEKWSFSIDRQDNGEKEKWFSHTLNDFINLPGSMPEKLKGDEVTAKTNGQAVSMTVPTIIIHTWKNTVRR